MNVSVFYGKIVTSTAGKKGYVLSVCANHGKLECLICADENEKEFAVDIKNIISVDEKIIYEDRETAIKAAKPIRLGRAAFDENGKYLGKLEELTYRGTKLLKAKIGKKNYPAQQIVCGDAVLVNKVSKLKYDVVKDGKVIIKKGVALTADTLKAAEQAGEYIQTSLKTL